MTNFIKMFVSSIPTKIFVKVINFEWEPVVNDFICIFS